MTNDSESMKRLLDRIQWLETQPKRPPTHRNIWQGSYDVWSCEQDRIDAIQIPLAKMKDAEERGFIESKIKDKYNNAIWSLTDAGREFLHVKN